MEKTFKVGDTVAAIIDEVKYKGVITCDDKGDFMPYFVQFEDGHGCWCDGYELSAA